MKEKGKMIVYGGEGCQQCKIVKMMLDSKGIDYDYVDVYDDEDAQHHLKNKVGDFSIPKIEYGNNVHNYSAETMEAIYKDFS